MTVDGNLEAWEVGERRRTRIAIGFAVALIAQTIAIAILIVWVFDLRSVATGFEGNQREGACVTATSARFFAGIADLIEATDVGTPAEVITARSALIDVTDELEAIASGAPCTSTEEQ